MLEMESIMVELIINGINLNIFANKEDLGKKAANDARELLHKIIEEKGEVNCVFAAAPSQIEFLDHLLEQDIDWSCVKAFHMDEYYGLKYQDDSSFGTFLHDHIFGKVPLKAAYYIDGTADYETEITRYSKLLLENPIDVVFCGIGENGHIAFNDPPVDFSEQAIMKFVKLDNTCRQQQVNDGCFPNFESVPENALTITVPFLCDSPNIFCIVSNSRKANAVRNTLQGPISGECPASYLKTNKNVRMYIDKDAASELTDIDLKHKRVFKA